MRWEKRAKWEEAGETKKVRTEAKREREKKEQTGRDEAQKEAVLSSHEP